jgi:dihydroxy-acid dehydratase
MMMGTASTMACMVESLHVPVRCRSHTGGGLTKKALAHLSGRRIVEMVKEDLRISKF